MNAPGALKTTDSPQSGSVAPFASDNGHAPQEPLIELSVVMPCLNEAETLLVCIEKAFGFMERAGISGEVVVADNGSTDGSQRIALSAGARVVDVPQRGYGVALLGGIRAARGRFVVMGDSDDSYDFGELDLYLERLRAGDELVMGNRFRGGVAPGAMPRLHRYFGNPFLTFAGRILYGSPVGDFQCGLRGFRRESMLGVGLRAEGMEFASEMVMKSTLFGLRIGEVPIKLAPDGRSRPPHIRSWRDGWRNLRLLLMHSPRWLYSVPGAAALAIGVGLMVAVLLGPERLAGLNTGSESLVFGGGLAVLGSQMLSLGSIARRIGRRHGHLPPAKGRGAASGLRLEQMLLIALLLFGGGLGALLLAPNSVPALHRTVPAVASMVIAMQLALFGFLAEFLGLSPPRND